MKISIIGLGYVGLPLLLLSESKGVNVFGYDVDEKKINLIKKGKSPIKGKEIQEGLDKYQLKVDSNPEILKGSDYFVVAVPTPVRGKEPDYSYIKSASKIISNYLTKGATVIIESTIAPKICRNIVKPILEETGMKVGEDVYLAHCPERIDPGNKKWKLNDIPRVVGGYTPAGRKRAVEFYSKILDGGIFEVSSLEVAESSKIVENSFRDINIAFVNELARIFDKAGIPTKEVIEAASTKPFGFMAHWPGCGVGGHCIPVDPYLLIKESERSGYEPELLLRARKVNESMPNYTVQRVVKALNEVKRPVSGVKIALLGVAYKGNVDDIRGSPGLKIKQLLRDLGADVKVYDPYVGSESDYSSLEETFGSECLVIATNHSEFKSLENLDLKNVKVIVDGRNMLDKEKIKVKYLGVGNS